MIGRLFEQLIFRLVRLFYAQIEVRGTWPEKGPVIFVLNHPNGLLDPALVMAARLEKVMFLAKSTLFAMPVVAWAARQFGALPIFRSVDLGKRGAALDLEDMAARNEQTFELCRKRLRQGRALALFPEGKTHDTPQLLPIRTGAARIALTAAREAGWSSGLTIVPVGLWYENMTRFRTRAILNVGRKVTVDNWQEACVSDAREAVQQLTADIEQRLEDTLLQAESHRLVRGVSILAAWTAPGEQVDRAGPQLDWSARLLRAHGYLQIHAPDRIRRIEESSTSFGVMLQTAGIDDPWDLQHTQSGLGYLVRRVCLLVVLIAPALPGALLSLLPWCVMRVLSRHLRRTDVGTIKLLGGAILSAVSIVAFTTAMAMVLGVWWGLATLILAPGCMYASLRWQELYQATRTAMTVHRLRRRRTPLVEHLTQCRARLAEAVLDALTQVENEP